jgi:hypothetical protein
MTKNTRSNDGASVVSQVATQTLSLLVDNGRVENAQIYVQRVETNFPVDAPTEAADWQLAQGRRPTRTNGVFPKPH